MALERSDAKQLAKKSKNWSAQKKFNIFRRKTQNHRAGRDSRKSFLLSQDRGESAQAVIGLTNLVLKALLSDGSGSTSFPRLPAPVLPHLYHLEVIPDISADFLDNT